MFNLEQEWPDKFGSGILPLPLHIEMKFKTEGRVKETIIIALFLTLNVDSLLNVFVVALWLKTQPNVPQ